MPNDEINWNNECQHRLEDQLQSLAKDPLDANSIREQAAFFVEIYTQNDAAEGTGFRHDYSGIATAIYGGAPPSTREEVQKATADIQLISSNIDQIWDYLCEDANAKREVLKSFSKLKSHISLEMQQISMLESVCSDLDETNARLVSTKKELEEKTRETEGMLDDTKNELQSMKRDYIAILGIFAAVVLVVNSAISFSAASVSEIAAHFAFVNVLVIILTVGIISINLVAILLDFIWFLTRDNGNNKRPKLPWVIVAVIDIIIVIAAVYLFLSCS